MYVVFHSNKQSFPLATSSRLDTIMAHACLLLADSSEWQNKFQGQATHKINVLMWECSLKGLATFSRAKRVPAVTFTLMQE